MDISKAGPTAFRPQVPVEDRKVIFQRGTSNIKITINPCQGEIRVKTPLGVFEDQYKAYKKYEDSLKMLILKIKNFEEFWSVTYRGRVKIHRGAYKIDLQSENKKSCFKFEQVIQEHPYWDARIFTC